VHVCFFSWVMKGFFDGVEPEMEHAAYIDGCSHWGAFVRIVLRRRGRGSWRSASSAGCFTWNEFSCSPYPDREPGRPLLTVTMPSSVHELGVEWHLMSATAVMAMVPAAIVTLFAQKYGRLGPPALSAARHASVPSRETSARRSGMTMAAPWRIKRGH